MDKQKAKLSLGWADRTVCIQRPASAFQCRKESDFPDWVTTVSHTLRRRCCIECYNQR